MIVLYLVENPLIIILLERYDDIASSFSFIYCDISWIILGFISLEAVRTFNFLTISSTKQIFDQEIIYL